ncbi:hypothetical protein EHO59_17990 [Leptospira semungkisensis]|uniref:Uncharacterized protein n=1 Tax=Leptospira semungkisensis TaxID=2484985 RepID=A0A4R9FM21_9LEPT|nr:hypothetical protein [Leptospira semungkisensis]TGJ99721.1 hypothetical protein EHO59_17990 [Leptospira semungkisensis]
MKLRVTALLLAYLAFSNCYSSTVFYFHNLRMNQIPPGVQQALYKQDEKACGDSVRNILLRIPQKNPSATHIRDLEILKKEDGLFSSCYRLHYGLEISH